MNRRAEIRDYVMKRLQEVLTLASVVSSKRTPVEQDTPILVNVSIDREFNEAFAQSPIEVKKTAELSIEVVALDPGCESSANLIDATTVGIEQALHADESFGDLINHCTLKHTECFYPREGEEERGMVRMLYEVTYTAYAKPTVDLDDFTSAKVYFGRKGTNDSK